MWRCPRSRAAAAQRFHVPRRMRRNTAQLKIVKVAGNVTDERQQLSIRKNVVIMCTISIFTPSSTKINPEPGAELGHSLWNHHGHSEWAPCAEQALSRNISRFWFHEECKINREMNNSIRYQYESKLSKLNRVWQNYRKTKIGAIGAIFLITVHFRHIKVSTNINWWQAISLPFQAIELCSRCGRYAHKSTALQLHQAWSLPYKWCTDLN